MDKIAIIGLGYVGLPLAHAFSEKYTVIGFDTAQWRIDELINGQDRTFELSVEQVNEAILNGVKFTSNVEDIAICNIYIITVPTPLDKHKRPDITQLKKASETISKVLKKKDIVIFESTVYPGATEEDCVPVLEQYSGLKFNQDFFCGYSPERINPGDKDHVVKNIKKLTAGSTLGTGRKVDELYKSIITAGTYLVSTIKIAEAAKVIENSQRDLNIAFMNELAIIFNKLGIDTKEVLDAAGTKWNFLPFKPGFVGGHCIGVDPYYLAHKAHEVGCNPELILAARRVNDGMGVYVANQIIKLMIKKGQKIGGAQVLILGITFKENCPDVRNSKVVDLINELKDFGVIISVYDPWVDVKKVACEFDIEVMERSALNLQDFNVVVLAVAHDEFRAMSFKKNEKQVVYDVKSVLNYSDGRL